MAADEQPSPDHKTKASGTPNGDEDRTPTQDPGRPPVSRRHAMRTGLAALSGTAAASIPGLASGGPRPGTSADRGRLVLKERELAPKINKLFQKLARDAKARKAFVEDPGSILIREVLPPRYAKISKPRIANANRLLYSLQSNDGFRKWANSYQRGLARKKRVDRGQVLHDLATAMAKHADPAFVKAILEEQVALRQDGFTCQGWVLAIGAFIIAVAAVILAAAVLASMTVIGPDRDVKITPAQMRAISQQLVAHAAQVRKTGKLSRQIIPLR